MTLETAKELQKYYGLSDKDCFLRWQNEMHDLFLDEVVEIYTLVQGEIRYKALLSLCAELVEAGEKATEGPWRVQKIYDSQYRYNVLPVLKKSYPFADGDDPVPWEGLTEVDAKFIATSRNLVNKLSELLTKTVA